MRVRKIAADVQKRIQVLGFGFGDWKLNLAIEDQRDGAGLNLEDYDLKVQI